MKTEILASQLIETLKKSKLNKGSKDFLNNLISMRENYELSKGNFMLKIEIYTDDDFSVNGESPNFSGEVLISDPQKVYQEFMAYIESLKFECHPSGQHRIDSFKELLKIYEEEISTTGELSAGGNQTIDVSVCPVSPFINIGGVVLNLAQ